MVLVLFKLQAHHIFLIQEEETHSDPTFRDMFKSLGTEFPAGGFFD